MLQTYTASNSILFESRNTLNSVIIRNLYSQTSHSILVIMGNLYSQTSHFILVIMRYLYSQTPHLDSNISQLLHEINQNIALPIDYKRCYSCSFQIKSGQYPEFKLVNGKFILGTLILQFTSYLVAQSEAFNYMC